MKEAKTGLSNTPALSRSEQLAWSFIGWCCGTALALYAKGLGWW